MSGKQGHDPKRNEIDRPRRRDHHMPTRHKMNPNWTRRGMCRVAAQ